MVRIMSVSIGPGNTAWTAIPRVASSPRSAWVTEYAAALAAE